MAQIGDILAKLGRRETLNTAEQQAIRLWGNKVENNSAFIDGVQNGRSSINAASVISEQIISRRNTLGGMGYFYYNESVPTGVSTGLTPTAFFNDLFTVSGTKVYFNTSGFYLAVQRFQTNATGVTFTGIWESSFNDGFKASVYSYRSEEYFEQRAYHTTGSSQSFQGIVWLWKIREYEPSVRT